LFTYEDAINGGKPKAEAAAENLSKIQPSIISKGYNMKIPMPGHIQDESEIPQALKDVETLDQLVQEHDVIYLLLDTREARWLGSLLAAVHNKICISVGLGFDNFVVIRHGVGVLEHNPKLHGPRSGCYFCSDYISPSNTMRDRTLDQQCTVTRPGLSFVASAYASELLVNYLHKKAIDV
jgi:ubiquitin-like modifier-activating enzyme ATG7